MLATTPTTPAALGAELGAAGVGPPQPAKANAPAATTVKSKDGTREAGVDKPAAGAEE
ncbi:MAG: hypothetical protein J2P20_05285 [Pseudonocardia sp.]|nr:hypothetical protein [Pseudonocardia sp.]